MSILSVSLQGRFGNQTLQWLFAYAFAQKHGMEFQCPSWVGERLFDLPQYGRWRGEEFPRVNEHTIFTTWRDDRNAKWDFENGTHKPGIDLEFRGYAQMQQCMIYSKRDAQSWLRLRPEIEALCKEAIGDANNEFPVVAHQRRGDYFGYSYVVPTLDSYRRAADEFGLAWHRTEIVSEENPRKHPGLPDELSFAVDFYRMMTAKTLIRANSSFSWLAGLLGNGLVLAPVIDGLEGGKEHYCRFIAGNHPRFANLDFVTDMRVSD